VITYRRDMYFPLYSQFPNNVRLFDTDDSFWGDAWINSYKPCNNMPMETKLGSTVYFATLTRRLSAQFAPFAAVFPCVVGGVMCTSMECRVGLCLHAEGDQFQPVNYFNIHYLIRSIRTSLCSSKLKPRCHYDCNDRYKRRQKAARCSW
jgi:hypothetical protein